MDREPMGNGIINKKETNIADFPIRQPQVRISLPTEEEPPKDRMDPGLQEVRVMDQGKRIIADLCLFSRLSISTFITLLSSTRTRTRIAWIESIGCTRRVSLRRSPRRGAGRTLRFRWVILLEDWRWDGTLDCDDGGPLVANLAPPSSIRHDSTPLPYPLLRHRTN